MGESEDETSWCVPCLDGVHDLCEDRECSCDRAEHPNRPEGAETW